MREILFRGKRLDNGEWVYGDYSINIDGSENVRARDAVWHPMVDPVTIGQYTGLKDKNGVKIFEGDIVESDRFDAAEVIWHDRRLTGWLAKMEDERLFLSKDFEMHVIGTIHDKENQ